MDCLSNGMELARRQVAAGADLLATGDMGIGNTTASSAITSVLVGVSPERSTGRGTGVTDAVLARKIGVVRRAIEVNRPDPGDPLGVLAKVGGFEIGFLAGIILGGAVAQKPVVLDGFISGAAALLACAINPAARQYLVASHRSAESGHSIQLKHLKLRPLLALRMRLGEGSGAALALPIVDAAARCLREMATFEEASVSGRSAG